MPCRHHDVQVFDNLQCCLACGEAVMGSVPNPDSELPRVQNAPYRYAHLNYALGQEIRLCVLFPGRPVDGIMVDLVHVNINDHLPYEAISYAWATQEGDDSLSQTVYCRNGTISVTKTCEAALRRLRWQGRNRYLWVDAVCIDQTNVKERNHQVGFMGTIYANASQVIVYLGPGSEATDRVLDYLNDNAMAFAKVRRDRISGLIKDFLGYRWFDRVWVLQEIALARLATMIAGEKSARWTLVSINKLLTLCNNLGIEPPSALRWLPASQPERNILSVLHKSRNCSSTDPRDKVFAVLGLAHTDFQSGFPVDYSLTVEEVYTRLATHLIHIEGNLRVLKYATSQPQTRDIPSWVPQWDIKVGCGSLLPQLKAPEMELLASSWSTSPAHSLSSSLEQSDDLLQQFLDYLPKDVQPLSTAALLQWYTLWLSEPKAIARKLTIHPETAALAVSRIRFPDFHFAIDKRETRTQIQSLASWESYTPTFSPRPCLRVRAHLLDSIKNVIGTRFAHQTPNAPKKFLQVFGDHRLCYPCTKHFVAKPVCQHTPTIAHTIFEEFCRDMKKVPGARKTMFMTQRSIGVAHASLCVGDSIWMLDSVDVPFVLRRVDQHYVLVGECFLYRALRDSLCVCCGVEVEAWPVVTHIIDIW